MRLISLDTETTGSSPARGDRCVEIGMVEIVDGALTGRTYQTYLNPERPVAWQAQRVHGLTDRFLADKPLLREVAPEVLEFIGDAPCVAHGARFDRDMLLYDFHHAGLNVPALTFYDSLAFARAHVRAPAYKLDTLARTMGLIDQDRGLHGALEDAEILARVICQIETGRPGALAAWVRSSNALKSHPKGWGGPAGEQVPRAPAPAPSRAIEDQVSLSPPKATPAPYPSSGALTEAEEAERITKIVLTALEGSPDLPLFADRLTTAGVLVRPVVNGDLALHGVRFSTPLASFTGGAMGLTGSALGRSGITYQHPNHAPLVERLVRAHDAVMGPIQRMKARFTAKPTSSLSPTRDMQGEEARERLRRTIIAAIPGTVSIFELAAKLEPLGVITETRIDAKRLRVSTVLFLGEGARVPGSRVGLRPRDRGPAFWSLEPPPAPVRAGPDGRVVASAEPSPPKDQIRIPTRIGEGLNPGVSELIAEVNQGSVLISPETVSGVRCGRDGWSRLRGPELWDILLTEIQEQHILDATEDLPEPDLTSALRWMCRGLDPERCRELHLTRIEIREAGQAQRSELPVP